MISSAKTLFLATLVFNAATVFGAPIRNVDTSSESVARAEMSTPVQPVARAAIVDVPDNRRRSLLGHVTRRSARLVSERDEPLSEAVVVAREPEPVVDVVAPIVQSRERRYPRRALHDRHETRETHKPAVTVLGVSMVPAVDPSVTVNARERRYPRRALYDLHEKREPATSIKETTTVVEKITVLDTPEDAIAFNANNPGSSASASSSVSTLVSISATTTLASDSSATATATATSLATDSVSASSTASSASATATSSASSTTDSVSATATPSASSTSSATDSSITASPTSTASSGDSTASASSTSSAAKADPTPAAGGDAISVNSRSPPVTGAGDPEARRGIYIRASTEPILRRVAFSGASWASSVKRQLNTH